MRDRLDSLTRRRLLGAAGTLAAVGGAGCTEEIGEEFPPDRKSPVADLVPTLPVEERTEVVAEGVEETAGTEIADEDDFEATLDEFSLEVDSIERTADVLTVEYVAGGLYEEGVLHDLGPIAGAYAALIESGYDSRVLGITILDTAPATFGSATVETEWVDRYHEGAYSTAEYAEMVMGTVESKRHPPEVDATPDE